MLHIIGLVQDGISLGKADLFPKWVSVVIYCVIIFAIFWVVKSFLVDVFKQLFSKTVTIDAKLVSKIAEQYVTKKAYATQGNVATGLAEKGIEYKFYFETADGKRVTLVVPKSKFDVAVEETEGKLTYKGTQFIEYVARTEGTVVDNDIIKNDFVPITKNFR